MHKLAYDRVHGHGGVPDNIHVARVDDGAESESVSTTISSDHTRSVGVMTTTVDDYYCRPYRLFGSIGAMADIVGGRMHAAKLINAMFDQFNKFLHGQIDARFEFSKPNTFLCRENTTYLFCESDKLQVSTTINISGISWKVSGVVIASLSRGIANAWMDTVRSEIISRVITSKLLYHSYVSSDIIHVSLMTLIMTSIRSMLFEFSTPILLAPNV